MVKKFHSLLNNASILQDFSLVDKVIPCLVFEHANTFLTSLPKIVETKNFLFSLKKDNASDPYGFSPFFFRTYWHIIKEDVYNATICFLKDN